jgi:hypothetical protein
MTLPNILLIENEWEKKKKLILLLVSNDIEVIPVDSLFNAQKIMRVITPQLLICSEYLPDGDVTDFLSMIRSSKDFSELPLVVLAQSNDSDSKKYTKQGATEIIFPVTGNDQCIKLIMKQINIHLPGIQSTSSGITGQLHKLSITDLIYELAQRHGSGKITIDGPKEMEIYLKNGRIIHARHGVTVGKKALFRCLRIADAAYQFQRNIGDVEPTIEDRELEHLIREAGMSNQKLMVNFHRYPTKFSRINIVNSQFTQQPNLNPKIKAGLEIIKRYPLVYKFVDFLNLPDIECYDMLSSFYQKGVITFSKKEKTTTILVDNSCDLSPLDFTKHKVSVLPLSLKVAKDILPNRSIHSKNFIDYGTKQWDVCQVIPFSKEGFYQCFSTLNKEYEILTITPKSGLIPTQETIAPIMKELKTHGLEGARLQDYETSVYKSNTFSLGYALLTIKAAQLATENLPVELLIEKLKYLEERLQLFWIENQSSEGFLGKNKQLILHHWNGTIIEKVKKLGKDEKPISAFRDEINRRIDIKSSLCIAVGSPKSLETKEMLEAFSNEFVYATTYGFDLTPVNMKIMGSQIQAMAFLQD